MLRSLVVITVLAYIAALPMKNANALEAYATEGCEAIALTIASNIGKAFWSDNVQNAEDIEIAIQTLEVQLKLFKRMECAPDVLAGKIGEIASQNESLAMKLKALAKKNNVKY